MPAFITDMRLAMETSGAEEQEEQKPKTQKMFRNRSNYQRNPTQVGSETLLEAKGNWNIVEQGGAMDPTQAHLQARENVNVKRRKKKKELSAHFEPDAKSGEDGKMRVLRLEREGSIFDGDSSEYDLAESSVVKPSHTVAENDLLQKIKALFGEKDTGSKSLNESSEIIEVSGIIESSGIIKPGHKPSRVNAGSKEEQAHMIGGVVVPPALPMRKISKASDPAQKQVSKGIIRPRVKPTISAYKIVQSATNEKKERVKAVKVRSGRHSGKTRLVIEITQPTEYKVAIDRVRNVLRVKLENTHWAISPQSRFEKSALLGTYIAREQGDGSVLFEVRLEKKSRIINTMLLHSNLSSKHRVVIDLAE
ncbi:MAG: hypothetical protein KAJ29_04560 [Alphaproteobacteria bacterium]|nr:hypothetical protein [Alphaproteobacteria bacterium]